ncbi:hypothetical protein GF373_04985, partial [bacterium]|nr:hypothetical protein [bacterium]
MPGDVNAELNGLLEHKNAGMRRTSLQCLIEREPKNLHGLLVQSLSDSSAMVRKEAIAGMMEFGTQDDFPTLLDIMLAADAAGVRNSAQQAVQVIGAKVPVYTRDKPFAKELPTASAANQVKLIELMHHFGGVYSFKAVKMELDSKNDRVQKAALKAMMNWPDGAPLETLKTMAQKAEKDEKRRKALRGFLRSIRLSTN